MHRSIEIGIKTTAFFPMLILTNIDTVFDANSFIWGRLVQRIDETF